MKIETSSVENSFLKSYPVKRIPINCKKTVQLNEVMFLHNHDISLTSKKEK
jgi:hypothetical protein